MILQKSMKTTKLFFYLTFVVDGIVMHMHDVTHDHKWLLKYCHHYTYCYTNKLLGNNSHVWKWAYVYVFYDISQNIRYIQIYVFLHCNVLQRYVYAYVPYICIITLFECSQENS